MIKRHGAELPEAAIRMHAEHSDVLPVIAEKGLAKNCSTFECP